MARSTAAADDAGSKDSEYKAAASEDSESDEAFAAAKGKPNPGGTGKKLQRKGKVGNKKTAAIQAKDPPPAKKAKTPTDKVCSSYLLMLISLLTKRIHIFLRIHMFRQSYEFICNSPYEFILSLNII
jgi:hypothetical protein